MDYNKLTKEQLIEIIEELRILNHQLLSESEQESGLDFAWTGNLGHWYWNIKTNSVTFNPLKVISLGYSKDEIPEKVTYEFFTEKLHSEDYQKTMDAMIEHMSGKVNAYEVEYRIRTKQGSYKWFYDRGRITQFDNQGRPVFMAGIVFDITEKKEKQMDLECKNMILTEQSSTDGLTKTKNYRSLIMHLSAEAEMAKHQSKPLGLALIDIDNFKKINDSQGHMFGNKVLVELANIIKNNIRETDILGRFGGEEFMIVFPKTTLREAFAITERIREAVALYTFDNDVKITVSGGVKDYHGEELTAFVEAVDMNLYEAKKRGKNQIV